jgi:hypothetical protein
MPACHMLAEILAAADAHVWAVASMGRWPVECNSYPSI